SETIVAAADRGSMRLFSHARRAHPSGDCRSRLQIRLPRLSQEDNSISSAQVLFVNFYGYLRHQRTSAGSKSSAIVTRSTILAPSPRPGDSLRSSDLNLLWHWLPEASLWGGVCLWQLVSRGPGPRTRRATPKGLEVGLYEQTPGETESAVCSG